MFSPSLFKHLFFLITFSRRRTRFQGKVKLTTRVRYTESGKTNENALNIWIGKIVNGGIIFRERGRIRRGCTAIQRIYTWYIQALLGSNQEAIHIVTTKRSLYENGFDKECLALAPLAILIGDRQLSIAPFPSICIGRSSTTDVFKKTLSINDRDVGKWKLLCVVNDNVGRSSI